MRVWSYAAIAVCVALFALAAYFKGSDMLLERHPESWLNTAEIDNEVNACFDLNQYANRKWIAANPVPSDQTRWGNFEILHQKSLDAQRAIVESAAAHAGNAAPGSAEQLVGYMYASGMDEARIERAGYAPIKPELDKIAALKNTRDIVKYLTGAFARGYSPLFNISAFADFKNASMQIAYASQGGLGLPAPDYYSQMRYADTRAAYQSHIARLLQLANIGVGLAEKQAKQVFAFEARLAKAKLSPVELRDPARQYHFVSVAAANRITPHFEWGAFFKAQGVHLKQGFSLSQPKFFAEIDKMLTDTPLAQWQAYLRFHILSGAAPYLSSAFQKEDFAFYNQTLNGQQAMQPRWKRVLSVVNDQLDMALGQLYIAQYFTPQTKRHAQALVDNLRRALKARIEKLDWMSNTTKQKALEKWRSLLVKIGYPDKWRDWSGLTLNATDYFSNIQAALKFNHAYEMSKVGRPTDRFEWTMSPQTVNAYYDPTNNTINFPAAILQPPFFSAQADEALNYGGIGAVIGHEMIHGYDDEGSQFDASGNQVNWWSVADRQAFNAHTAKLVEQFNAYSPLPGLRVNGQLTLGENIADLGGLEAAYDALQMALRKNSSLARAKFDGYSQSQRFFINWALIWRANIRPETLKVRLNIDPHAPMQYRAIGAPSNMLSFANAFSCKAGEAMVRAAPVRVKIW